MTLRRRIVLAVACGVGALVAMLLYTADVRGRSVDERAGALQRYGGEIAQVCVAARDIARGETFTERNVQTVEWLVDLLPDGAITDAAYLLGTTSAASVARNTPLTPLFVDEGESALEVPAGLVAVSVPCSAETAVGGAIAPNAAVDLYVVTDGLAHALAHGVTVLQAGPGIAGSGQSWATVALPPSLVEAVIAASGLQRLYFALPGEGAVAPDVLDDAASYSDRDASGSVPALIEAPAGEDAVDEGV